MLLIAFLAACTDGKDTGTEIVGDATAGEAVYTANCSSCHGADGTGATADASDLTVVTNELTDTAMATAINDGKGTMPGFSSSLDEQAVADVIAYLHEAFGG
ncbi:MAG: cytochrome c [Pseudomonadota bacterium]|nr:cytochrome c [Pseudomonadota bacterium]